MSQVVTEKLVVPSSGLFSLRFDLPQGAIQQNRVVFNNAISAPSDNYLAPAVLSPEIVVSSGGSAVQKVRSYVLRVITPVNEQGEVESSEDISLTEEDIFDLSTGKLFQRLGDNRYRIYMIREDGNQVLLKDFYLRNHRPIEIDDTPASAIGLPIDEPVLDKAPSAAIPMKDGGMTGIQDGESEAMESRTVAKDEFASGMKGDEKPMTNATLIVGTVTQATRSWRKAARRFRSS
jgi:hypothetical protein